MFFKALRLVASWPLKIVSLPVRALIAQITRPNHRTARSTYHNLEYETEQDESSETRSDVALSRVRTGSLGVICTNLEDIKLGEDGFLTNRIGRGAPLPFHTPTPSTLLVQFAETRRHLFITQQSTTLAATIVNLSRDINFSAKITHARYSVIRRGGDTREKLSLSVETSPMGDKTNKRSISKAPYVGGLSSKWLPEGQQVFLSVIPVMYQCKLTSFPMTGYSCRNLKGACLSKRVVQITHVSEIPSFVKIYDPYVSECRLEKWYVYSRTAPRSDIAAKISQVVNPQLSGAFQSRYAIQDEICRPSGEQIRTDASCHGESELSLTEGPISPLNSSCSTLICSGARDSYTVLEQGAVHGDGLLPQPSLHKDAGLQAEVAHNYNEACADPSGSVSRPFSNHVKLQSETRFVRSEREKEGPEDNTHAPARLEKENNSNDGPSGAQGRRKRARGSRGRGKKNRRLQAAAAEKEGGAIDSSHADTMEQVGTSSKPPVKVKSEKRNKQPGKGGGNSAIPKDSSNGGECSSSTPRLTSESNLSKENLNVLRMDIVFDEPERPTDEAGTTHRDNEVAEEGADQISRKNGRRRRARGSRGRGRKARRAQEQMSGEPEQGSSPGCGKCDEARQPPGTVVKNESKGLLQ